MTSLLDDANALLKLKRGGGGSWKTRTHQEKLWWFRADQMAWWEYSTRNKKIEKLKRTSLKL